LNDDILSGLTSTLVILTEPDEFAFWGRLDSQL